MIRADPDMVAVRALLLFLQILVVFGCVGLACTLLTLLPHAH